MAELTSFGFRPGRSLPHRLDVRFKLLFLILISLISLSGDFLSLGIFTCLLTALAIHCRLPLRSGLKTLRFFLFLLVLYYNHFAEVDAGTVCLVSLDALISLAMTFIQAWQEPCIKFFVHTLLWHSTPILVSTRFSPLLSSGIVALSVLKMLRRPAVDSCRVAVLITVVNQWMNVYWL